MQQFKLTVTPIPVKRLELVQTLESLLELYRPYCDEINLAESKRQIIISGTVKDMGRLKKITDSKEFEILSGALSMLAVKTDFYFKGKRDVIKIEESQTSKN